jgi:hypothetical protein
MVDFYTAIACETVCDELSVPTASNGAGTQQHGVGILVQGVEACLGGQGSAAAGFLPLVVCLSARAKCLRWCAAMAGGASPASSASMTVSPRCISLYPRVARPVPLPTRAPTDDCAYTAGSPKDSSSGSRSGRGSGGGGGFLEKVGRGLFGSAASEASPVDSDASFCSVRPPCPAAGAPAVGVAVGLPVHRGDCGAR